MIRHQFRRTLPAIVIAVACQGILLSGCSCIQSCLQATTDPSATASAEAQNGQQNIDTRFAEATDNLSKGEHQKTGKLLEEVLGAPTQTGITDVALFQLALINLRNTSREGTAKTQQYLQRLTREYPQSAWSQLGQPVTELLDTLTEQRKQVATLKNQNQALSKEIKDLHLTIDRLKTLDLELERKNRR